MPQTRSERTIALTLVLGLAVLTEAVASGRIDLLTFVF